MKKQPNYINRYELSKHGRRQGTSQGTRHNTIQGAKKGTRKGNKQNLYLLGFNTKKNFNKTTLTIQSKLNKVYATQSPEKIDSAISSPRFNDPSKLNEIPTVIHDVTFSSRSNIKSAK
jgi:hypothetical protein